MHNQLPAKLFAGPTLNETCIQLATSKGVEIVPPIRRFDLPKLLDNGFMGVLIMVDGYFYQDMSVGHAEIMDALKRGLKIYGLSSMGAIRAYEMKSFGMIGFGKVFNWFNRMEDFQDDEVALLHGEAPKYLQLSEPLVHFRECLEQLKNSNLISDEEASEIVKILKNQHFGERTMEQFHQLLRLYTPLDPEVVCKDFDRFRIKSLDLLKFLQEAPWLDHGTTTGP